LIFKTHLNLYQYYNKCVIARPPRLFTRPYREADESPSFTYAELMRYDWKDKPDQILLNYINNNMAKLAELLKEMGVIDEVPNPLPVIPSRHFNQKAPYGNSKLLPSSFTSVRPEKETLNAPYMINACIGTPKNRLIHLIPVFFACFSHK